jgi:hypothetical protein
MRWVPVPELEAMLDRAEATKAELEKLVAKACERSSVWKTEVTAAGLDKSMATLEATIAAKRFEIKMAVAEATAKTMLIQPPAIAETLIPLLMPKKRADALLGDLREQFTADVKRRGEHRARWLYRARAAHSMGPLLWRWMVKGGIFAAVAAVARRYLGG